MTITHVMNRVFIFMSLAIYSVAPMNVSAAPGNLSDKPLFLGTEVQPNILWLVDDSGSMDWEVLKTSGALKAYSSNSFPNSGDIDITPTETDRDEMLESCAGYNVMYYDPSKTYTPWAGVDINGDAYTDQPITAARRNPYNPGSGTVNLTASDGAHFPGYFVWNDANGNDEFDSGECPDPGITGYNYAAQFTDTSSTSGPTEMSALDKANFANWYSYYRKREYVAKRALSTIIDNSQARMGLATLHNNNSVGTIVDDVDDVSVPVDATAQTNKNALLRNLFRIDSSGGTPLRTKLEQAGKYFEVGTNPGSSFFGFTPSPTSPILSAANGGECQQNFTVLMSDGYWNGSAPSVGNADANTANEFDGGSYADTLSNTLADVAMHYYKNDLATGLDNNVPVMAGVDENNAQHMVTYTVAFGVNGNLIANPTDKDDPFPETNLTSPVVIGWPIAPDGDNSDNAVTIDGVSYDKDDFELSDDRIATVDDMRHAAWNGRGLFLNARNPDTLISSLESAINDIADREGSASAVAFNSTSLETDTLVFQARFDSGSWNGTLLAFDFDTNGVGSQQWSAGDQLDARDLSADARNIISYNGTQGVSFRFPVDYTAPLVTELAFDQQVDLLTNAPFPIATVDATEQTANQAYGEKIVDYLRGDFSGEEANGGIFRNRYDKRLGDIVHSSPEFVGAPNRAYPDLIEGAANKYSDFIEAKKNRTPIVYVGANDGMLHAFRASDGHEVMAYIPSILYSGKNQSGLHFLADTSYSHIPYVDESPLAADVFVDSDWKTYLVGALRAGGKGVYVLDVTNPSALTESNAASIVKKEFTHNDLGYTFSRPLVGKMNNGRWAAIFGNGYNNDPTGDGKAKLFIMYLDSTGGYELIDTNVGSVVSNDCSNASSDCNGLSSPTVLDLNGNGTIDRVYAADIQGNVWAFNLTSSTASNWSVAYKDSGSIPQPLFSACSASPCTSLNRQSITSLAVAKTHPYRVSNSTEPNLMVYFGTGQYIAENDNLSTGTQSMYGVWDAGVAELDRSKLQQQVLSVSATVTGGRDLTSNAVNYTTTSELGWYIDLVDSGERIVVEPAVVGDIVFFNTMVPDDASCNGGGYGYLMFADRITGGQPDFTVLDINNDGVYDDDTVAGLALNAIPGGARLIDDKLVVSDSSGMISDFGVQSGKARASSRASWSIFK